MKTIRFELREWRNSGYVDVSLRDYSEMASPRRLPPAAYVPCGLDTQLHDFSREIYESQNVIRTALKTKLNIFQANKNIRRWRFATQTKRNLFGKNPIRVRIDFALSNSIITFTSTEDNLDLSTRLRRGLQLGGARAWQNDLQIPTSGNGLGFDHSR